MRRLLLDTNAVLRLAFEHDAVPRRARAAIERRERFVSYVSAIEMAIKHSIGKLRLPPSYQVSFQNGFVESLRELAADVLPLDLAHIDGLSRLPLIHRDPFDRLLIAQALAEDLAIVSRDRKFRLYPGLEVVEI